MKRTHWMALSGLFALPIAGTIVFLRMGAPTISSGAGAHRSAEGSAPAAAAPPASDRGPSAESPPTRAPIRAQSLAYAQDTRLGSTDAVMDLYERIGEIVEAHADDCSAMGTNLSAVVKASAGAVEEYRAEQEKLTDEQRSSMQERLARDYASDIERSQQSIRQAMSSCGDNPTVREAFRTLARRGAQ